MSYRLDFEKFPCLRKYLTFVDYHFTVYKNVLHIEAAFCKKPGVLHLVLLFTCFINWEISNYKLCNNPSAPFAAALLS